MNTHTTFRPTRIIVAIFAALMLTVTGLFVGATQASAHDKLIGTDPGDQKVLDKAPEQVKLQFNNSVLDVGTVIKVEDADGKNVAEGEPDLDGPVVTQALSDGIEDGAYQVVWRVVSSDGHPINGRFAFAVGDEGDKALEDLQNATDDQGASDEDDSHEHSHGDSDASDKNQSDQKANTGTDNTGQIVTASIIGGVGLIVIIGVAVIVYRRGKRKRQSTDDQASKTRADDTQTPSDSTES
jgi:methionine-rich copper-binding protein CopC